MLLPYYKKKCSIIHSLIWSCHNDSHEMEISFKIKERRKVWFGLIA